MKILAALALLAVTLLPAQALPANDYGDAANWLCRPGADDACAKADLSTTVISADGKLSNEAFKPDPRAPIDCFYVYPTISREPGGNSSMTIAPEDLIVVQHQAARLASVCRLFAPKYRSGTLAALRVRLSGKPNPADPELAYGDVKDAWNSYLAHDNHGRGVVLIGHSQGSGMLHRLIMEEIDGKPSQKLLVSAILMGFTLAVPPGADVGGDFKSVALCRTQAQTGCAVAFASFRAETPPPANALFGKVNRVGMSGTAPNTALAAACVNPAAPGGGSVPLKSYLSAKFVAIVGNPQPNPDWVTPAAPITTAFVRLPGLVRGECVSTSDGNYLAVSITPQPGDKRARTIPGDVVSGGQVQGQWGLHLIDANLVMGNLLDLITSQGRSWLRTHR